MTLPRKLLIGLLAVMLFMLGFGVDRTWAPDCPSCIGERGSSVSGIALVPMHGDTADAERISQRKQAPSLLKAEELAGRWDAVLAECRSDVALKEGDEHYLWYVHFEYPDSDYRSVAGFGATLEEAARNAVKDFAIVRANVAAEDIKKQKKREALTLVLQDVHCEPAPCAKDGKK